MQDHSPEAGVFGNPIGLVFLLVIVVFSLYLNWRIAHKTGYPGAMSLLMLIPLVNLIVFILLAFTEWPIERQLKAERLANAERGPAGGGVEYPPTGLSPRR